VAAAAEYEETFLGSLGLKKNRCGGETVLAMQFRPRYSRLAICGLGRLGMTKLSW
jgi:hypothetical protein